MPRWTWISLALRLLVGAAILSGCKTAAGEPTDLTGEVLTYRGNAARTGVMPGPGPGDLPKVIWTFEAGAVFESSPVVRDGTVFAASSDGVVRALRLTTGSVVWQTSLGEPATGTPLLIGDALVLGDEAGRVHALDVKTGSQRWLTATDGAIRGSAVDSGGQIVVATAGGSAYALDADSGEQARRIDLGSGAARSPSYAAGTLAFGAAGEIILVSTADGSVIWRTDVGAGQVGTTTIAGGLVVAATGLDSDSAGDFGVVAISAETGAVAWRYTSPTKAKVYTPAIVDGRVIVAGHDRLVVSLDIATGGTQWTRSTDSDVEALPVSVGSVVYVVPNNGPAMALDAATGSVIWSVPISGVPFAPTVVDGYLLVATDLGALHAIAGSR